MPDSTMALDINAVASLAQPWPGAENHSPPAASIHPGSSDAAAAFVMDCPGCIGASAHGLVAGHGVKLAVMRGVPFTRIRRIGANKPSL
ncbi:MAG: hypothetical protein HHJ09_09260 [Glaciimonas sp.]|nr:hypothetical protein [Glaciimonas sp.]